MSHAARKPPAAAPTVKPFVTIIIVAIRIRLGLNSPISAVAFGNTAPSPKPARKRMIPSSVSDVARADSSVNIENAIVAQSSTRRRPTLSPSMPNSIEPMNKPKSPDINTGVSVSLVDLPVRDDRGRDVAHRLHVEAVHDEEQPAEEEDADLVAIQAAGVDDSADVDLGLRHDPPSTTRRRPGAAPMRAAIIAEGLDACGSMPRPRTYCANQPISPARARACATRSPARTRARARRRAPRRAADP